MKRLFAVVLVLTLALSLCACGGGNVTEVCTEHNWGDWEVVTESGEFAPGQSKRLCKVCGAEEVRNEYYKMLLHYSEIIRWLPFFTEAERLQQSIDSVITAAFFGGVAHDTIINEDDSFYYHIIKVSDLNEFTTKVFGCTYDYTGVSNLEVLLECNASYDAAQDAILIKALGAGDEMPVLTDVSYEETEGGTLMVTAYFEFHGQINEKCFCVAKHGDNYVITTY